MYQLPLFQYTIDRDKQVRYWGPWNLRMPFIQAMTFILPFVDMSHEPPAFDLFFRHGGRIEFVPNSRTEVPPMEWIESVRTYSHWYHNIFTGETWNKLTWVV
jgi:hypothetical protein